MKNLQLTEHEYQIVKQAIELHNDFMNDMLFEPSNEDGTMTVSHEELTNLIDQQRAIASLCSKLGIETNDQGYAV